MKRILAILAVFLVMICILYMREQMNLKDNNNKKSEESSIYYAYDLAKDSKESLAISYVDTILAVTDKYITYIGNNDKIGIITRSNNKVRYVDDAEKDYFRTGKSKVYNVKDNYMYYSLYNGEGITSSFNKLNLDTLEKTEFDFKRKDIQKLNTKEFLSLDSNSVYLDETGLYLFLRESRVYEGKYLIKNVLHIDWNYEVVKLIEGTSIEYVKVKGGSLYAILDNNKDYNVSVVDRNSYEVKNYFIEKDNLNICISGDNIYSIIEKDGGSEIYVANDEYEQGISIYKTHFKITGFLSGDDVLYIVGKSGEGKSQFYVYDVNNDRLDFICDIYGEKITLVKNNNVYNCFDRIEHKENKGLIMNETECSNEYFYFYVNWPQKNIRAKLCGINVKDRKLIEIQDIEKISGDVDRMLFYRDTLVFKDRVYYYTYKNTYNELIECIE